MPTLSGNQVEILIETIANTAGIDQAVAALGVLEAEAKSKAAAVKSALNTAGLAGLAMSAGIIAGVAATSKAASDFQQQMTLIQTQAGASAQEVQNMSQAVLQIAPSLATGPTALAQALFYVESAGYRGAAALNLMTVAAEGAKVGNADLNTVTDALVATMNTHIKGVNDATEAMGYLNAIVGAGMMHMQDLTDSLSTGVLPAAKSFGLSMQDVGAALATMTDLGVPAIDAATRLRMSFSLMGAPTAAAVKELKSIGMTSTELGVDMRTQGLIPALQDLKNHLEDAGLTAEQQNEVIARSFGGGRSSTAIITLLQNMDRLKSKFQDIGATANNFGEQWSATQQTAAFNFQKFDASIQTLAITFGATLLPVVTKFVNFLTNNVIPAVQRVINFFAQHKAAATALEIVIGVLLVGALVLVVAWFAGLVAAVAAAIGVVAGFIGVSAGLVAIIIGGIVAAVIILINYWKELGSVFTAIGAVIKSIVNDVANAVIGFVNMVINAINSLVQGAVGIANKLPGMHISIGSIPTIGGGGGGTPVNNMNIGITNNVTANTPFDLNSFNGSMGLQLSSALGR